MEVSDNQINSAIGLKYTREFLESKLVDSLDYQFLEQIKGKLPVNNAYFLVCMMDVLYNLDEEFEVDDVLDSVIGKAYHVYSNSDISSYLRNWQ